MSEAKRMTFILKKRLSLVSYMTVVSLQHIYYSDKPYASNCHKSPQSYPQKKKTAKKPGR